MIAMDQLPHSSDFSSSSDDSDNENKNKNVPGIQNKSIGKQPRPKKKGPKFDTGDVPVYQSGKKDPEGESYPLHASIEALITMHKDEWNNIIKTCLLDYPSLSLSENDMHNLLIDLAKDLFTWNHYILPDERECEFNGLILDLIAEKLEELNYRSLNLSSDIIEYIETLTASERKALLQDVKKQQEHNNQPTANNSLWGTIKNFFSR